MSLSAICGDILFSTFANQINIGVMFKHFSEAVESEHIAGYSICHESLDELFQSICI